MNSLHTPKQVSDALRDDRGPEWCAIYDTLRDYRLSNMTFEGTDDPFCLVDLVSTIGGDISTGEDELLALADEVSLALDALTLRSSAGVKVTDDMVDAAWDYFDQAGEWTPPKNHLRAALTAALALPSHAGEDDGAVAWRYAESDVEWGTTTEQAKAERLAEIVPVQPLYLRPSPSVPPQGDDDSATLAAACRKYNIGTVARLDEVVAGFRALASQTQGEGDARRIIAGIKNSLRLLNDEIPRIPTKQDPVVQNNISYHAAQIGEQLDRALSVLTPSPTPEPSDAEVER